MEDDKKLETLEDEFKLIKGELKQTLTSVRDYLMDPGLPPSEYARMLAAVGGADEIRMKAEMSPARRVPPPMEEEEELPSEEAIEQEEPPESELEESEVPESELAESEVPESELAESEVPESELAESEVPESELAESEMPESELAESEVPESELAESEVPESELAEEQMKYRKIGGEVSQSAPTVNLMANLIRWVSSAKKEIGNEQLPTLLEVYGISGHLSPELKEVILHLAEVMAEQTAGTSAAEIWSQLMSELHGILTGGDAPLHTLRPLWNDLESEAQLGEVEAEEEAEAEPDKPKDKPLKLKLVLSDGEGTNKEFCINLEQEVSKESF